MVSLAVWRSRGTEMAHWLLLQTKSVGVSNTPAKFIASWKSPSLVAPSPKWTTPARSSPFRFAAQDQPTA